jgi:TPR repeat protein
VPKNLDEAKSWLNKAAKGGSDDARQKLQELFHSTKDVDSNCPMPLSHCSFSWDNFEDDTVCKLAQAIGGKCNHIDEARKWIASRSPSDS